MQRVLLLSAALAFILVVPLSAAEPPAGAWVRRAGAEVGLGNNSLELWFSTKENQCKAVRLVNRLAGRTVPLRSDDLMIGLEGREAIRLADFTFKQAREETLPAGQRLTLQFERASEGLRLDIVYELGHADFFLRRRLELTPKDALALRQVDLWAVGVEGTCSHQGFGGPVLLDDTFWGVEFPAGQNQFAAGIVKLTQFPGRKVADRFVSKSVVLGVSEAGQAARRFRQYVETFRVTPKETSLFVNYNTWWTLMPPTEKNSLELLDLFKRKLFDPYGESIDTFTLDDGWDDKNSLWSIRSDRFPRGFGPLVERLKAMNARLGIWLSPSSGYNHAPWLSKHGYAGNSNPWFICQSDPKYRRDIVQVVTGLARQYEVAFFKFDGFSASCEAPGHTHLPGPYAKEANVDAFIELLTAVRQVRPNIYLDPTCGIWLSPWWLRYADSLWGEVSGDYPDIVVPAPVVRDSATTTRDAAFRQRCREHPGFPPAAIEHLGIIVISPEKWEDNAMIVVGRGCRLLTLYIDPSKFTGGDRDWLFLAKLLKWVRAHAATLQRTELVLGDPFRREPYGYAHFRDSQGILALRNPFIEPQKVALKLDESAGWARRDGPPDTPQPPCVARIVYPRHETLRSVVAYGDTLELELQGYETVILQVEPLKRDEPLLLGARHQETAREGNRLTCTLPGRPGEKRVLSFPGLKPIKATLDGQPVAVLPTGDLSLPAPAGAEQVSSVEGGMVTVDTSQSTWQIAGKCSTIVPNGTRAVAHVLFEPTMKTAEVVECKAQVNGQAVAVRAVRTPAKGDQAHGPHPWTWFEFDVPAGRSDVSFAVTPAKPVGALRARLGWWLWSEHPLTKNVLALEYSQPLPAARSEPLPLPIAMDRQRQVLAIQPLRAMTGGARWPRPEQQVVYLADISPDEASQDWGNLETDRSVWEKKMVIAGRQFERGVGTHANSRTVYDLRGGNFKTFRCQVGRDEHAQEGQISFEVWLDGKKVFDSGPMTKATAAKAVEVRVEGAGLLELRALDGGDGIAGDHADWAEARLLRAEANAKQ